MAVHDDLRPGRGGNTGSNHDAEQPNRRGPLRMSYLLINHAEDGRHLSVYKTEELARNELEAQIGRKVEGPITGRHFHDDWGRCFVVEKRPDNWSAKLEQ